MRAEEQFDSFYLKTRRALVHQTFALTGDLAAAQRAVRDAYVGAWHHWRKVKNQEDPRDWVRPRAWAQAQRRHTARLWQRTRDLSAEDRAVLDALHDLSGSERRALLLVELAGAPLEVAARELNVTRDALERQLGTATAAFAVGLGIDPADVRPRLLDLGDAAARATLPRPAVVRREGGNRRRTHSIVAAAAVTFLAVGSGAFAHEPGDGTLEAGPLTTAPGAEQTQAATEPVERPSPTPESTLPSAEDLLTAADLRLLDADTKWEVTDTHDNTSGDGLNYVCQQQRFADPEGLATLVQTAEAARKPPRTVVQAVEISASDDEATTAYDTVVSWFAGCDSGELQLQRAFDVKRVGDRAALFDLQGWGTPARTWSVGVAQVGQVVTTTVVRTVGGAETGAVRASRALATAARLICERAERDDCGDRPRLVLVPPPPSTEAKGALATVDMPALPSVGQPWVGLQPVPAPQSPVSPSSCDRAQFRKEGSTRTRTRTFLVPQSRLPARFGLTETYGSFGSAEQATSFMRTVRARFASCEDRDLATEVLAPQTFRQDRLRVSTWRLRTELSENREITYDVGFVRRGTAVAQVTFVPAPPADLPRATFRALVTRAGQRLAELP